MRLRVASVDIVSADVSILSHLSILSCKAAQLSCLDEVVSLPADVEPQSRAMSSWFPDVAGEGG